MTTTAPRDATTPLTTDRGVRRQLVHKRAVEHVLTTAVARHGDRLLGSAQLPRCHRYFNDTSTPYYDLLLVAEAARQTVEAMTHELLDVPLDARFVLGGLAVEITRLPALRVGPAPTDLAVELHIDRSRRSRSGTLRALEGVAQCHVEGEPAARFSGALRFVPADTYTDLRADPAPEPADTRADSPAAPAPGPADPLPPRGTPALVGRTDPRNVLIGRPDVRGRETLARVVPDPADPVFFDHPLDHLPGMLLVEAARQCALVTRARDSGVPVTALVATACRAAFREFAEHDAPLWCRARPEGPTGVRVSVEQRGRAIGTVDVEFTTSPDTAPTGEGLPSGHGGEPATDPGAGP
ncbi:A-factor biosynthesis hotdog domain protein [Streptomyces sp. YIM 121038]|uniref:ScbA/BarX family gamma-butyrolactone biosynthesis protein n=1 Tax=Streptomyces sp. YIM 121038 TaxID=2136401 RepID=UPI001163A6E6|nr:ScbA/BarX family gamma-butyrolactone biosynthesis protein [Streptomyces sp. YIM 121038]QCX81948.1 A-factor biosynthesis hotdog domain protein [Streptomyces sp. YIM 121038]